MFKKKLRISLGLGLPRSKRKFTFPRIGTPEAKNYTVSGMGLPKIILRLGGVLGLSIRTPAEPQVEVESGTLAPAEFLDLFPCHESFLTLLILIHGPGTPKRSLSFGS